MLVSARDDTDGGIWLNTLTMGGTHGGWARENQGWSSNHSPWLTVLASGVIYILIQGLNQGITYSKPGYSST